MQEKSAGSVKSHVSIKVTGIVKNITTPLEAPLTKRQCVFYTIKIEQKKGFRQHSHWKKIIFEEKIQDFLVHSKDEYILIKPRKNPLNYRSYLMPDQETYADAFKEPSPEFLSILLKYNLDIKGFLEINKHYRYQESIIGVGNQITVGGLPEWEQFDIPVPDYYHSKIVSLNANIEQTIFITDLPIKSKRLT